MVPPLTSSRPPSRLQCHPPRTRACCRSHQQASWAVLSMARPVPPLIAIVPPTGRAGIDGAGQRDPTRCRRSPRSWPPSPCRQRSRRRCEHETRATHQSRTHRGFGSAHQSAASPRYQARIGRPCRPLRLAPRVCRPAPPCRSWRQPSACRRRHPPDAAARLRFAPAATWTSPLSVVSVTVPASAYCATSKNCFWAPLTSISAPSSRRSVATGRRDIDVAAMGDNTAAEIDAAAGEQQPSSEAVV